MPTSPIPFTDLETTVLKYSHNNPRLAKLFKYDVNSRQIEDSFKRKENEFHQESQELNYPRQNSSSEYSTASQIHLDQSRSQLESNVSKGKLSNQLYKEQKQQELNKENINQYQINYQQNQNNEYSNIKRQLYNDQFTSNINANNHILKDAFIYSNLQGEYSLPHSIHANQSYPLNSKTDHVNSQELELIKEEEEEISTMNKIRNEMLGMRKEFDSLKVSSTRSSAQSIRSPHLTNESEGDEQIQNKVRINYQGSSKLNQLKTIEQPEAKQQTLQQQLLKKYESLLNELKFQQSPLQQKQNNIIQEQQLSAGNISIQQKDNKIKDSGALNIADYYVYQENQELPQSNTQSSNQFANIIYNTGQSPINYEQSYHLNNQINNNEFSQLQQEQQLENFQYLSNDEQALYQQQQLDAQLQQLSVIKEEEEDNTLEIHYFSGSTNPKRSQMNSLVIPFNNNNNSNSTNSVELITVQEDSIDSGKQIQQFRMSQVSKNQDILAKIAELDKKVKNALQKSEHK